MNLEVTLYTRENCEFCETAKQYLEDIQTEIPHTLIEVNIDEDPALVEVYDSRVPVVSAGPFTLEPPFDQRKLRMTLGAARDSQSQRLEDQGDRYRMAKERSQKLSIADRLSYFFSHNFLWIINVFLLIYFGLPFLAPVLMKSGYTAAAQPIYSVYGVSCHRLAFRSWFLFGEQPIYPREAANLEGYITYGEATGFDENDLWTARDFQGNEQMGYKVPFCQRDIAIYASMFLFGVIYGLSGGRIKPLSFWLWVVIGLGPIGLDGVSQLLSQFGGVFDFIPYRESTPLLRTITGALFGFFTGWFGFPIIDETMAESRRYLADKRARMQSRDSA
jgi:uncharacterized membrane protein/glutaredoxin